MIQWQGLHVSPATSTEIIRENNLCIKEGNEEKERLETRDGRQEKWRKGKREKRRKSEKGEMEKSNKGERVCDGLSVHRRN